MKRDRTTKISLFQSFPDKEVEANYGQWLLENTTIFTKKTGVVLSLIFTMFFVLDCIILGHFSWMSFVIRIALTVPAIIISITQFHKIKQLATRCNIMTTIELVVYISILLLCYVAEFPLSYIILLISFFMFLMSIAIGINSERQIYMLITVGLLSFIYLSFIHPVEFSFIETLIYISVIVINSILTIFANHTFDSQHREQFLKVLSIKSQNELVLSQKNQLAYINKMLAHDLKTPIRNISNFVALLQRKLPALENKEKELFDFIEMSSKKMSQLVSDYLEFAKLEEGNMQNSKIIDLSESIPKYVDRFKAENPLDKVSINVHGHLPKVTINKSILESLLHNLFVNALIYNESDKKEIDISSSQIGSFKVLNIKDNGIGIPKKYHDKVFQIFERLNPTDYKGGTGIGLAHCAEIMHRLNGKIKLVSEPDLGSTFSLYFPSEKPAAIHN